jgi:O-methyltransferase involved in polyketide biosynthesis
MASSATMLGLRRFIPDCGGAGMNTMRSIDRRKVEDWLARCRWLATTKLDDRTRDRLDRLVRTLEQDLEEDEVERLSQRRFGG